MESNANFNKTGPNVEAAAAELVPTYKKVPRFAAGSQESRDFFESEGFVIIAGALNKDEVAKAIDLTWDFVEGLGSGVDRSDPKTWVNEKWPTIAHGGIIPGHGIGHCEAQWFIRGVPNVKKGFAKIWGTDDLLASFDGMALWRPSHADPSWETNTGAAWLHVDQNPVSRPGFKCAQGLISLLPMDPSTGGNVLIPGSHKSVFPHIPEMYPERWSKIPEGMDHFRFPPNDENLLHRGGLNMSHMEPGDMLLWDSRLLHCSSPGIEPTKPDAPIALTRMVSLICMMPRELTSPEVIEWRKHAAKELIGTTNWTDRIVNADEFPNIKAVHDRDVARGIRKPPAPNLSPSQLKLVGYTDEEIAAKRSKL